MLKEEDKFCSACGVLATRMVSEEFSISSNNLIEKVKELLHEGNVTRIIVKDEQGKVLIEKETITCCTITNAFTS